MKRRLPAMLLALWMILLLCGVHCCAGEDCLYCAQSDEMRVHTLLCAVVLCACGAIFSCFHATDNTVGCVSYPHTLQELKVKLSD